MVKVYILGINLYIISRDPCGHIRCINPLVTLCIYICYTYIYICICIICIHSIHSPSWSSVIILCNWISRVFVPLVHIILLCVYILAPTKFQCGKYIQVSTRLYIFDLEKKKNFFLSKIYSIILLFIMKKLTLVSCVGEIEFYIVY